MDRKTYTKYNLGRSMPCLICGKPTRIPGKRVYTVESYKFSKNNYRTKSRKLHFCIECWGDLAGDDFDLDW